MRRAVLLLLLPLLHACTLLGTPGNGQRAVEKRPVDHFTRVEADGPFDVEVREAQGFSVQVNIDSNLLPLVETRASGGVLTIDARQPVRDLVPGPHVVVTLPHLEGASLLGSGRVTVGSFQETDRVDLILSGSGDLRFEGSSPSLVAQLSGSGALELTGSAARLDLDLSGSGSIGAVGLPATSATILLDGSGDVSATVEGSVDLTLSGSGNIELFGQPDIRQHSSPRPCR
jgi:Putative auto-transporter adhesin, head GIN domain